MAAFNIEKLAVEASSWVRWVNLASLLIGTCHYAKIVVVHLCMCVRTSGRWPEAIRSELKVSFLSIAGLGALQQTAHWHSWQWLQPWLKWTASNEGGAELDWSVWWPGEHNRVTLWNRCCPQVLFRKRRLYSNKRGSLVSKPAELVLQRVSLASWVT